MDGRVVSDETRNNRHDQDEKKVGKHAYHNVLPREDAEQIDTRDDEVPWRMVFHVIRGIIRCKSGRMGGGGWAECPRPIPMRGSLPGWCGRSISRGWIGGPHA